MPTPISPKILPYIAQAEQLQSNLTHPNLLIVDLGSLAEYQAEHIPGAVHLDVANLRRDTNGGRFAAGLLPPIDFLLQSLEQIGLGFNQHQHHQQRHDKQQHVIAYDHGYNAQSCRLLWTLAYLGHDSHSLLDGGMSGWRRANYACESSVNLPRVENFPEKFPQKFSPKFTPRMDETVMADKNYVLAALSNPDIQILDARSQLEHNGIQSASSTKGKIPGAINLDWLETVDAERKFISQNALENLLKSRGIASATESAEKEIIVYCQTHTRSSHSFVMLKSIGYQQVRGYPGSWAEWANDPDLPKA